MPVQILREPKVTLLARQNYLGAPHIQWQSDSEVPAQGLAEFAGRLCYLSFGTESKMEGGHRPVQGRTSNREYLENILQVKHGSVLEHAVWSFLFEGISRALTHELVRHRHLSYSQLSQRYVDESEVAFVLPPEIEPEDKAFEIWKASCQRSLADYRELLDQIEKQVQEETSATMRRKRARQTARSVLPNCTETKIVVTGNGRAWRHFIELRASAAADKEIRRLALVVLGALQEEAPNIFGDYRVVTQPDGTETVETDHPAV